VLRGFGERLDGIRGVPDGWGVVLRGRSIHTMGMRRPIGVVWLDAGGVVVRRRVLPPGRVAASVQAAWVVEVPADAGLPRIGRVLGAWPILAGWPEP
jgi:hypothetical protein